MGTFETFLDNNNNIIVVGSDVRNKIDLSGVYRVPVIYKYDQNGELIWQQEYILNGEKSYFITDGIQLEDGDFIFVGVNRVNRQQLEERDDLVILRTDSLGELLWEENYIYNEPIITSDLHNIQTDSILGKGGEINDFTDTTYLNYPIVHAHKVELDFEGN